MTACAPACPLTARDCPEALLTRGVPYLQLDQLVVYPNLLYFEVNPVCTGEAGGAALELQLCARSWWGERPRLSDLVRTPTVSPQHSPNGGDEAGGEGILREAQEQATLSHACVHMCVVRTCRTNSILRSMLQLMLLPGTLTTVPNQ